MPESEAAAAARRSAGRGPDRRQPALRHQRDLERHHPQRHPQPDQHGGAARAQGRDRDRRAHGRQAEEAGSISWSRRARSSTTAGSRRTCTARCSPRSRRRRSSCSTSTSTRSRPRSTSARSRTRSPARTRPADERFLRSVEEKIKVSDSGKQSFRQEVVRKAMVAFKAGEKFTLGSHARMREAIEQYLFEERRDVLRLVTSTARPDDEARQKISVVQQRLIDGVRLRRAQRQGGAELRDHPAGAGVARTMRLPRSTSDAHGRERQARRSTRCGKVVRAVLARRARLAAPQREGARSGARAACPRSSPAPTCINEGARTVRVPVRMLEHYHFRLRDRRGAAGRRPGQGQARRRARRARARTGARARRAAAGSDDGGVAAPARVQGRRHRRLAVGGAAAAQPQGARRSRRRDATGCARAGTGAARARGSTGAARSRKP